MEPGKEGGEGGASGGENQNPDWKFSITLHTYTHFDGAVAGAAQTSVLAPLALPCVLRCHYYLSHAQMS